MRLDPCGHVMDLLRPGQLYTTDCVVSEDSSVPPIRITWYKAAEGAAVFPGAHIFGSKHVWDADTDTFPVLGETRDPARRKHRSGKRDALPPPTPGCFLGTLRQFEDGLTAADMAAAPPPHPPCCPTYSAAPGGGARGGAGAADLPPVRRGGCVRSGAADVYTPPVRLGGDARGGAGLVGQSVPAGLGGDARGGAAQLADALGGSGGDARGGAAQLADALGGSGGDARSGGVAGVSTAWYLLTTAGLGGDARGGAARTDDSQGTPGGVLRGGFSLWALGEVGPPPPPPPGGGGGGFP